MWKVHSRTDNIQYVFFVHSFNQETGISLTTHTHKVRVGLCVVRVRVHMDREWRDGVGSYQCPCSEGHIVHQGFQP